MATRPMRVPLLAAALLAAASVLAAQKFPTPPRPDWEAGWHVIRPGDTLEGLARRLLGSNLRWRELHALNPWIADPDLLRPGWRIRVWFAHPAPPTQAQVEAVAGRVDELPQPVPWRKAGEGDLLLERDGVRTFARGSSRLRFDDGATVTLTENSLVFLRRRAPVQAPAPRREIEVRVGRADFEAAPRPGPAPEIDIVLGKAARGRAGGSAEGGLAARTGTLDDGGGRLMIYRGSGELAAAGQTVALAAGTGSSVEPKQPPRPAEVLLPAPALDVPEADGPLGLDDPWLTWAAVPGAASYEVELCADADCGRVLERAAALAETRYRVAAALAAPAFWRVTATSPSGLDGFPSVARRFAPAASVPPPPPVLVLRGADGTPLDEGACAAAVPAVEVTASDRYGRPLPWALGVDDREVPVAGAFPASRPYRVTAIARAPGGLTAASPARAFVLDLTAPWADLPAAPGTSKARGFGGAPRRPLEQACELGLELSAAGGPWTAVPCPLEDAAASASVPLAGERADLRLRAARSVRLGDRLTLAAGEAVALDVGDLGCGLAGARLALAAGPDGGAGLAVEVSDRAGRTGRSFWRLDKR